MKKVNLAVVGATGMVGRTFLKVLKEKNFPIDNLYLMASKRSAALSLNMTEKNILLKNLQSIHLTNRLTSLFSQQAVQQAKSSLLSLPLMV